MTKKFLLPLFTNPLFRSSDLEEFFHQGFSGWENAKESSVSVYEDQNHIYVEAGVPGLNPEDIEVTLEKGLLWIRGEKQEEKEEKEVKYHSKASSSFSYKVYLPSKIEETKMPEATCEKGVLTITFTKSKASIPQKILVK